jgi:hypothetical protein
MVLKKEKNKINKTDKKRTLKFKTGKVNVRKY